MATNKGLVRGITQKIFTGKFVDAFLGIPFAQPPVGKYRFRHPQQVNPWRGELDASRMPHSCYQVNDTFFGANFLGTSIWNANTPLHEDCLYLNIWTPFGVASTVRPSSSSGTGNVYESSDLTSKVDRPQLGSSQSHRTNKRPVLVWIFGGGFYSGTSSLSLYEGGALASEEDIIVVSMNYRVSALGFLYFGRPDAPGNAGLFDQLMALQWINDNIDQFGGDPQRVTIFGESAGAVSVAYHLLSPLSRNLFSQAILQSGAATCPWGLMETRDIISNGLQLAEQLNCPSSQSDMDAVIECLLSADAMSMVSQKVNSSRSILNFPFVPVVDGSFLVESPVESLAKANFKHARILLGSNHNEASSFFSYLPEFSQCPTSASLSQEQRQQSSLSTADPSTMLVDERKLSPSPLISELQAVPSEANNYQRLRELVGDGGSSTSTPESVAWSVPLKSSNYDWVEKRSTKPLETTVTVGKHYPENREGNIILDQRFQDYTQNDTKPCKLKEPLSFTQEDFVRILGEGLNPYAEHPIAREAIIFEYLDWSNVTDPESIYDALDKVVGDYYFTCHVNEFAYHYTRAGNEVYMYYFKHRSSVSPWPKYMGVLHADEINFVFGEPLNPMYNYTEKEIDLSRRMMRYWASFARYGNPTGNGSGDGGGTAERWPVYGDKKEYFELHGDHAGIGRGPRAKQCAFWSQYLPQLIRTVGLSGNQCPGSSDGDPASSGTATSFSPLIHPYAAGQQLGRLKTGAHAAHHNSGQGNCSTATPSGASIVFVLFVILTLLALGAVSYATLGKRSWWKPSFNFWPSGGAPNAAAGGNGAGGSGGANDRSPSPVSASSPANRRPN